MRSAAHRATIVRDKERDRPSHRFMRGVALVWLIAQGANTAGHAETTSPAPSVAIEPDNISLTAKAPNETITGSILVSAHGIPWADLTVQARWLNLGKNYAHLTFTQSGSKDSVNLGDLNCPAAKPCPVGFEIEGVNARGTYTGSVDIYSPTAKLASATINVLLAANSIDLTLTGDAVKNDVVSFDATQTHSLLLMATSGAGTPQRTYKIEAFLARSEPRSWLSRLMDGHGRCGGKDGQDSLNIDPASFSLDGGASQPILIQVPACLSIGTYTGFLKISDVDAPGLTTSKALTLKRDVGESSRRVVLLVWVVIGALLSVTLNNAFPLSRARAELFVDLRTIDVRIRAMSSIDPELRGSLFSESDRVWLLTDSINFWNSRKTAILNEAKQALEALKKLLDLAATVNALRSEAESAPIPIRSLLEIEKQLRLSEDALSQSDPASAQAPISAAKDRLAPSADSKEALAEALKCDITTLLADSRQEDIAVELPGPIEQRIRQLERDKPILGTKSLEDLLRIERNFYIARVWTHDVEIAVRANPERFTEPVRALFLSWLEAAPAGSHTQLLISLMCASIVPSKIEEALQSKQAQIVANPLPRFLALESYEFEFLDPALNSVPAVRNLPSYKWEFDDRTVPPDDGNRCKHFFLPERGWAHWGRIVAGKGPKRHEVHVTVSMPHLSQAEYSFTKTLEMRPQQEHASSLTAMQIVTFFITTGTAVLAAFGAQYASALPSDIDWGVSVTALLFGFGIDQVRDKAASS